MIIQIWLLLNSFPSILQISLLRPNEIDIVHLPSNTGVVRDMRILPDGLVLLASLGKRLSLFRCICSYLNCFQDPLFMLFVVNQVPGIYFSATSKNCILKYDLPVILRLFIIYLPGCSYRCLHMIPSFLIVLHLLKHLIGFVYCIF